jgi:uncharacterized RDD family membrane protein YckC
MRIKTISDSDIWQRLYQFYLHGLLCITIVVLVSDKVYVSYGVKMKATQTRPAGFWLRLAANLVDNFIITLVTFIIVFLATFIVSADQLSVLLATKEKLIGLYYVAFVLLYKAGFEASKRRASPGKRIVGISVVNSDCEQISFVRALLRNVLKVFSYAILGFGFLMAAFPGQKRCLHDLLTGCYVIRAR